MDFSICKLCNTEHHVKSGSFTRHLKKEHQLSYKDYLIKTEYNGVPPKCQCEQLDIFHKVKNGNSYNYLAEDEDVGIRLLTDFSIDDYEIEIKSTYIMKKQGGIVVLNAKRRAVEKTGKKYILILDKDYSEFAKLNK